MLDIIISLFRTIIHSIGTVLVIIIKIPYFISNLTSFMMCFPAYIVYPLMIAITVSVLIAIKRLVI